MTTNRSPPPRGMSEERKGTPSTVPVTRIRARSPPARRTSVGTDANVQVPTPGGRTSRARNVPTATTLPLIGGHTDCARWVADFPAGGRGLTANGSRAGTEETHYGLVPVSTLASGHDAWRHARGMLLPGAGRDRTSARAVFGAARATPGSIGEGLPLPQRGRRFLALGPRLVPGSVSSVCGALARATCPILSVQPTLVQASWGLAFRRHLASGSASEISEGRSPVSVVGGSSGRTGHVTRPDRADRIRPPSNRPDRRVTPDRSRRSSTL
jgi:hypothetical protein